MKLKYYLPILLATTPVLVSATPTEEPQVVSSPVDQNIVKLRECIERQVQGTEQNIQGKKYLTRELTIQYQLRDSNEGGFDTFEDKWIYMVGESPEDVVLGVAERKQRTDGLGMPSDTKKLSDKKADGELDHAYDTVYNRVIQSGSEMLNLQSDYESALQNAAAICEIGNVKPDYTCVGHTTEDLNKLQSSWVNSSVLLLDGEGNIFCSGTVIPEGQILTAGHCTKDLAVGGNVNVAWPVEKIGGKANLSKVHYTQAQFTDRGENIDTAILQLPENAKVDSLKVSDASQNPELGGVTYALGHPKSRAWTIMEESGFLPIEADDFTLQSQPGTVSGLPQKPLCWDHGLSGSPVLSEEGKIIGVVMAQTNVVEMPFITNLSGINSFLSTVTPLPEFEADIQTCSMEKTLIGLTPNGGIYKQSVDMKSCN